LRNLAITGEFDLVTFALKDEAQQVRNLFLVFNDQGRSMRDCAGIHDAIDRKMA
jgi:hypothetical protein